MARTDYDAVVLVIETSLTQPQVEAFIDDASLWVTNNLGSETSLSAETLAAIEKYLACHLVSLRDPRLKRMRMGDTSEEYQRDPKENEYLEAAASLDPTGSLDAAFRSDPRPKAVARVGKGYADS